REPLSDIVRSGSLKRFHEVHNRFRLKNILDDAHCILIQKTGCLALAVSNNLASVNCLRIMWINSCEFQGLGINRVSMLRIMFNEQRSTACSVIESAYLYFRTFEVIRIEPRGNHPFI